MKAISLAIGMIWLGAFLGAQRFVSLGGMSPIASNSAEITCHSGSSGKVIPAPPVEADHPDPRVDLLGNEVEHAVADYRIDHGGSVYERHSPETAMPRLGSPTS